MNAGEMKKVSKSMSDVLRHRPDSIGIELETAGWVGIDDLLKAFARSGKSYSRELIEFSDDATKIRARQGHLIEIDLAYESAFPPDVFFHGTAKHNLDSIFAQGLIKGRRHHVHMSTNKETMYAVAMRHAKPVLLQIDGKRMHADEQTGNCELRLSTVRPPGSGSLRYIAAGFRCQSGTRPRRQLRKHTLFCCCNARWTG